MAAIETLRAGGEAVGTMLRLLDQPALAPIAKAAGLDFIFVDLEHGAYALDRVAALTLSAAAHDLSVFVRVPELARGYVSRLLDCGAMGVMVPMLESEGQARQLVNWSKYAPLGRRGLGTYGGNTGYVGISGAVEYMAEANQQTLAIAQIETAAGVDAVQAIAGMAGIDVLLIGPNDLAISLGVAGDLANDVVRQAVEQVAAAAQQHGKILGMHAGPPLFEAWSHLDFRLRVQSLDVQILLDGMTDVARQARRQSDR